MRNTLIHYAPEGLSLQGHLPGCFADSSGLGEHFRYCMAENQSEFLGFAEDAASDFRRIFVLDARGERDMDWAAEIVEQCGKGEDFALFLADSESQPLPAVKVPSAEMKGCDFGSALSPRALRTVLVSVWENSRDEKSELLADPEGFSLLLRTEGEIRGLYDSTDAYLRHPLHKVEKACAAWDETDRMRVFVTSTYKAERLSLILESEKAEERGRAEIRALLRLLRDYMTKFLAQTAATPRQLSEAIGKYHCLASGCAPSDSLLHFDSHFAIDSARCQASLAYALGRTLRYGEELPDIETSRLLYLPFARWEEFLAQARKARKGWLLVHASDVEGEREQQLAAFMREEGTGGFPKLCIYNGDRSREILAALRRKFERVFEGVPPDRWRLVSLPVDIVEGRFFREEKFR